MTEDAREQFRAEYAATFRDYVAGGGESGLGRAWELGRRAVTDGLSVLDMAEVHHESLAPALELAQGPQDTERVAQAAADFFMESLSTFEMTQRGFREAQETARLEQQHSAQLRGLADASAEVNSALALEQRLQLITERAREIIGAHQAAVTVIAYEHGDSPLSAHSLSDKYGSFRDHDPTEERSGLYELLGSARGPVRLTEQELEAHPAWSGPRRGRLPLRGWLAVPLIDSAGHELGLIQLSDKHDGDFTENDQAMLVQLAQMAAVAIENARLYEHEHAIAETLQRSLLPPSLPVIPGVESSARFRPVGEGNEMGGDFYDLFEIGGSSWAIVIGDVCGKGAAAAAVTALARYTLRATALHETRPSRMLALLNEALLRQGTDERFCTVAYGRLEAGGGRTRIEVASGGHPLPVLVGADGSVSEIGNAGTVLGVMSDPVLLDESIELSEGDTVVFYTDGVTEARAPRRILGPPEIGAAIAACEPRDAPHVAECVERLALAGREAAPRDDIAVLALTIGGPGDLPEPAPTVRPTIEVRLRADAAAPAEARRVLEPLAPELGRALHEGVRLLVNELVSNSVRHARLAPGDEIGLSVAVLRDTLRVEVSDAGRSFEPGPPAPHPSGTSGWGLYLVDRLADRWGVHEAGGKRVWFEIDR